MGRLDKSMRTKAQSATNALGGLATIGAIVEAIRQLILALIARKNRAERRKERVFIEDEAEQITNEIDNNEIDDLNARWGWHTLGPLSN